MIKIYHLISFLSVQTDKCAKRKKSHITLIYFVKDRYDVSLQLFFNENNFTLLKNFISLFILYFKGFLNKRKKAFHLFLLKNLRNLKKSFTLKKGCFFLKVIKSKLKLKKILLLLFVIIQ